jgi:hypothetical protein
MATTNLAQGSVGEWVKEPGKDPRFDTQGTRRTDARYQNHETLLKQESLALKPV